MQYGRPIQTHLSACQAHSLSQPIMARGKVAVPFSVAKPTRLIIEQLYLYLQMAYNIIMMAHESSHVPESISAKKTTHFDKTFKSFSSNGSYVR